MKVLSFTLVVSALLCAIHTYELSAEDEAENLKAIGFDLNDFKEDYYDNLIDHFSYDNRNTYKQRYFINE